PCTGCERDSEAACLNGGLAASCELVHVVELQKLARRAPMTRASVACPHRTLDARRNVARVLRLDRLPGTGARVRRKLGLLELGNERIQSPLEQRRNILRRDLMAEQLLGVPELVVGVPAHGELHANDWRANGVTRAGGSARPGMHDASTFPGE